MLSQNIERKRSWLVPFSFLLIASLRTIFVVWLLLVWERVLCQRPCREVAEKWDFSTAKLILGEKNSQSLSTESRKKNSQVLPTGKQTQSTGKMNKNGQILFKKNDSSSMERALHHLRAGLGKDHGAKPSIFSQLWGCNPITCPNPTQAPHSLMGSSWNSSASTNYCPKTLNSIY